MKYRSAASVQSPLWACAFFLFLTAGMVGCDSQQRGESQSAASNDGPPPEQQALDLPPGLEADDPDSAEVAPEPTALQRYTDDLDGDGPLMVDIETSHGTIECRLFADEAPVTVANFVGLARGLKAFVDPTNHEPVSGIRYYDGVEFHRVIPNFFIQSGDRDGHGHSGPGYAIPDEISDALRHDRPGILSMANRGPDTGGSQFFILETAAPHLDGQHTVFGHCDSPDVIRTISHVPTADLNHPVDPAPHIETMRIYRAD